MDKKHSIEAAIAENAKRLSDLSGGDELSKRVKKRILQKLGKLKKELASISDVKATNDVSSTLPIDATDRDIKAVESAAMSKEERKLKLRHLNKDLAEFAQKKQLTLARKKFEQGIRKGVKVDVHTYTNLINVYVRCSDLQGAELLLQRMKSERIQPNLVTYTTLLKGYSESGDMTSASKIYFSGMSAVGGPNVRALNTFLRACVRTGMVKPALQSYFDFLLRREDSKNINQMVCAGGDNKKRKLQREGQDVESQPSSVVESSEYTLDASSYEYLIGLLCRAGQLNTAEDILRRFTSDTLALSSKGVSAGGVSAIENTAIYISLAAAETLRGSYSAAQKWVDLAVDALKRTETATLKESMLKRFQAENFAGNNSGTKRKSDAQDESRSVALFLKHRRSELEGRLESIQDYLNHALSRSTSSTTQSNSVDSIVSSITAQAVACISNLECLSQVLNFGFDGRCDFDIHELSGLAADSAPHLVKSEAILDSEQHEPEVSNRLVCALIDKYGLNTFNVSPLPNLTSNTKTQSSLQQSISQLSAKITETRKAVELKLRSTIDPMTKKIVFPALFRPLNAASSIVMDELPIKLEICSGDGEWIVAQAQADWTSTAGGTERAPRALWVALELRCDRIQNTLSHYILSNPVANLPASPIASFITSRDSQNAKLVHNLALLGGNAAKIIPERIEAESVSEIFINHPQPPDRVTGGGDANLNKSNLKFTGKGNSGHEKNQGAHLLTQEFFAQLVKVLKPGGAITIVTDNQSYGKSLAASIAALPIQDCPRADELPGQGYKAVLTGGVDRFNLPNDWDHNLDDSHSVLALPTAASPSSVAHCGCTVDLWRGDPGPEIGHVIQASSYFDRMWDLGQKKRRWFIYVKKATI